MPAWLHSLLLFALCAGCGGLGALLGLGGGIMVVPLLVFGYGLDFSQAAASSLVGCLATSAAGSLGLERSQRVNYALVAELEVFTALGALGAAALAPQIPPALLALLFGAVTLIAAWKIVRRELWRKAPGSAVPSTDAAPASREDAFPALGPGRHALAWALSCLAGAISSLLGIGGGPVKVPLQTEVLRQPLPVALANSNLMVGITAAFGAAVYYGSGLIRPEETAAVCLGMAGGAYLGGRLAPRVHTRLLAGAFVLVLGYLAARMLWTALRSVV